MALFKLRANGTPPYTYVARDFTNTIGFSSTSTSDEMEVPDSVIDALVGGIKATVTDSTGKQNTIECDIPSLKILRKYHAGVSISNPDINNIVEAVQLGHGWNFSWASGVPDLDAFGISNDTQLLAFGNTVYNHTVDTGGVYAVPYDRCVHEAWLTGALDVRTSLISCILLTFNVNKLNNGGTRTKFIDSSDLCMMPDGTSPISIPSGATYGNGSFASQNFKDFADLFITGFVKRYLPAINDGTILCFGPVFTNAAEAEYETESRGYSPTVYPSRGDFNPAMITAFKAEFPEYSSKTNNEIADADQTNTDLGRDWTWFLSDMMKQFEHGRIQAASEVTGLLRKKYGMQQSGSFLDGLAPRRRTFNSYDRIHPATIFFKGNDNNGSDDTNRFVCEYLSSLARKYGGIAIWEISPTDYDFGSPSCRHAARTAKEYGVGISCFGYSAVNPFDEEAHIKTPSIPLRKNEFSGGNLSRLSHPLTNIYSTGGTYQMQLAYQALKASTGLSRADIITQDNVAPVLP